MTDTPPAGCSHAICLPLNGDGCQLDRTPATDTAAVLAATWTAVPNDEIGGWAVTTDGRTPAAGGVMAADMMWSREIAEHIAAVHNAWLATRLVTVRTGGTAVVRGERFEVTPLTLTPRDAEAMIARHRDVVDMFSATAGPLSAPTTAERGVPAPEPTPNPAQAD
ncbi:hypothetical protein AB0L22_08865 [Micromonospora haikouensis]|uniref:hypothetical protein n=1 Tax=Micromonospora haikouensis TaxID=686309 RepID=UPI0034305E0D